MCLHVIGKGTCWVNSYCFLSAFPFLLMHWWRDISLASRFISFTFLVKWKQNDASLLVWLFGSKCIYIIIFFSSSSFHPQTEWPHLGQWTGTRASPLVFPYISCNCLLCRWSLWVYMRGTSVKKTGFYWGESGRNHWQMDTVWRLSLQIISDEWAHVDDSWKGQNLSLLCSCVSMVWRTGSTSQV